MTVAPTDLSPRATAGHPLVAEVRSHAYSVPTERPEADGTLEWDRTTLVVVEVDAGPETGTGYTYAPAAAVRIVADTLAGVVTGRDPMAVGAAWSAMARAVRNQGRRGPVSAAISALDVALWDLKARLLGLPLVDVLDRCHDRVPAYGSGGFTNLTDEQLAEQLAGWAAEGLGGVKLKVGTDPDDDPRRVALARSVIGGDVALFVDANGAFARKQALLLAERFAEQGVRWFEEPVSSDDLVGLRLLRDRAPAGMEITAGEYGWDLSHFRRLLDGEAVDCLQADVTRCGGITSFLRVGALCDAAGLDLSAHCAPQLSAHALAGVWHARHLEYFADHVRLEAMAFDGVLRPDHGALAPDRDRPGHGLEVRWPDLEPFRATEGGHRR